MRRPGVRGKEEESEGFVLQVEMDAQGRTLSGNDDGDNLVQSVHGF